MIRKQVRVEAVAAEVAEAGAVVEDVVVVQSRRVIQSTMYVL